MRHAQGAHAISSADVDHYRRDNRMKVIVLMDIDVIQRQPGCAKSGELRFNFSAHLTPGGAADREVEAEARKVRAQSPGAIDEIGNLRRRQSGPSVGQSKMKSDAQARHRSSAPHRVLDRAARRHQTGRGEDSLLVRDLDRLVHFARQAEIVRCDDETAQCAKLLRSRRNEKNSTPSRSRRRSISGLFAISATIAAIFGARK